MLAVGLTGGIGSGKSTVARGLVALGAVLIDADVIAREVVEPGGPAYAPLVGRFGPGIVTADGTIDRSALAALTFPDPAALADLNAITHPAVGAEMYERLRAQAGTDSVVVLDIPLLRSEHRELLSLDVVVVVDCPTDVALRRLVEERGFERADAEARIAAQVSRAQRLERADLIIDNSSTIEELDAAVARVWGLLEKMAPGHQGG